jgi:hypothetical protein
MENVTRADGAAGVNNTAAFAKPLAQPADGTLVDGLTLHRHDDVDFYLIPAPLAPAIPILVADFVDTYEKGGDGRWRIRERHIHRIFVDSLASGPLGEKAVAK